MQPPAMRNANASRLALRLKLSFDVCTERFRRFLRRAHAISRGKQRNMQAKLSTLQHGDHRQNGLETSCASIVAAWKLEACSCTRHTKVEEIQQNRQAYCRSEL
eukprot:6190583-Pleurochrysis_carterae.AAC.2